MLQLREITKIYPSSGEDVAALRGISIDFRRSEFVSILGPSGCGKTTLLNIVGGLDGYTSGDLVIDGKSTKKFKDPDWDAYRSRSIGFVFQSYNLIPHQSALANVELAMTISGVSRAQRRRRAIEALKKVGLEQHMYKRPNQMSGGQMQRVAIARSLVNDPEILLADEPTGALDTENSIQIMEILKSISRDRLVIMVTHNPELAETYSNRIIRLLDGQVQSDSNPCTSEEIEKETALQERKQKKPSVSFLTALSLSCNNLLTKKTRTILTAFAGSIGIIGIALIISLSTGIQNYIDKVQKDTLSSYPITIEEQSVDLSDVVTSFMSSGKNEEHGLDRVYANPIMNNLMDSMTNVEVTRNNLTAFRDHLENDEEINKYIDVVQYSYNVPFDVYTRDVNGVLINCDVSSVMQDMMKSMSGGEGNFSRMNSEMMAGGMKIWQEMLPGGNGEKINPMLFDQYDLLAGAWPENYDEVVCIVNANNEISDLVLYSIGMKSADELEELSRNFIKGETEKGQVESWGYDEVIGKTFKLILPAERYTFDPITGTYNDITQNDTGIEFLYDSASTGTQLKIVGIVRENDDAVATMMTGSIGYTKDLTDHMMEKTAGTEIVKAQLNDPDMDAVTALPFLDDADAITIAEKRSAADEYITELDEAHKAELYRLVAAQPDEEYVAMTVEQNMAGITREYAESTLAPQYAQQIGADEATVSQYMKSMDDETLFAYIRQSLTEQVREQYSAAAQMNMAALDDAALAAALDMLEPTDEQYSFIYDECMPAQYSSSSYDIRLSELGYADPESPNRISIYTSTFENKDEIANCIASYNENVQESDKITYTDYIALLMSSITTIIDVISYVLIAFVAISLVVSSIMIGIITYISVLERTKEIGILRAIGASKRDVSRVFNAETLIVGLTAGAIGIGLTMLLNIPISIIVQHLTDISDIAAVLPGRAALILVLISMFLTLIAGLIPAKMASKKDPVVALRNE